MVYSTRSSAIAVVPGAFRGPRVGIFWQVWNRIITDNVDEAEAYGDFQTHGAHAEYWEKITAMTPKEIKREGLPRVILVTEYDQWPRGAPMRMSTKYGRSATRCARQTTLGEGRASGEG